MSIRLICSGLAFVLLTGLLPLVARADDLADIAPRALSIVATHLTSPKLNSAYGTPAFDAQGRRIGEVFLNYCGQGPTGEWMLMSLTLHPDGSLTGEGDEDNPRPDEWGHHLKLGLDLVAWPSPEEGVRSALALHGGHGPTDGVSLAMLTSKEHQGRAILVLYWLNDHVIYDVVTDAKYGALISTGQTPWPHHANPSAAVVAAGGGSRMGAMAPAVQAQP